MNGKMPVILIVDDEESIRESLQLILEDTYTILTVTNGQEAIELIEKNDVDIVLLDLFMPVMDGRETLNRLKDIAPDIDVVVVTAINSVKEAVECIRQGAYDYITKPFEPDEILSVVSRIIEKQRLKNEVEYLRSEIERIWGFDDIITRNQKMLEIFRIIKNVASASTSVLITGESGTGKELIARCIHRESPRNKEPFVAINCAAIPPELMESEFFGHEKGAFTGAYTKMIGKFEYANGGTIFLDEISNLRLDLQAKLLRVLQDMEITRIGSLKPIKVDVRIIAATNTDLNDLVKKHLFRDDLYYRLNVVPIKLPPLKERRDDIPLLAAHFLDKYTKRFNKKIRGFSPKVMTALCKYRWRGNIRELENLIERMVVLSCDKDELSMSDLPLDIMVEMQDVAIPMDEIAGLFEAREIFEKTYLLAVLEKTGWDYQKAARLLKIHRNTLIHRMRRLNIKEKMD